MVTLAASAVGTVPAVTVLSILRDREVVDRQLDRLLAVLVEPRLDPFPDDLVLGFDNCGGDAVLVGRGEHRGIVGDGEDHRDASVVQVARHASRCEELAG